MTTMTLRAKGSASPEQAWERYARPSLWSSWSPQIRRVELSDVGVSDVEASADDRIRLGLTGIVHGPAGLRVRFRVIEVDEVGRSWSWRAEVGPIGLELGHWVSAEPTGCSTRLTVRGPLPVVVGYLVPARVALSRLVRA